jgi:hypothetical protein
MRYRIGVAAAATLLVTSSAISAIAGSAPADTITTAALPTISRTTPDTANRSQVRPSLTHQPAKPRALHTRASKKATPSHQPKHTKEPSPTPRPTHTITTTTPPPAAPSDPKAYALAQVGATQFACLELLWEKESNWRVTATNPSSGAYGIPQALPGSKMASAGSDWQTNAITQIRWGLGYIKAVYGTPCTAWAHSQATNWY